jgi:hypothetical protein
LTTIATMSEQPRLKIRIPKSSWNAYDAQPQLPLRRVTRAATCAFSTSISSLAVTGKQGNSEKKNLPSPPTSTVETTSRPRSCKVKLWGFHHGGPKRVIKGALQNEVIYETPCLRPICANCWKWHPHLMRERTLSDYLSGEVVPEKSGPNIHPAKPEFEPLSPPIDPHILDGTWRIYQSRRSSSSALRSITSSTINTPVLTPVKTSFYGTHDQDHHLIPPHFSSSLPSRQDYKFYLPAPLLTQALTTAPATTTWRSTPRRRYTARLTFASHEGKGKFKDLIRKRERRAKRQEYDGIHRARKARKGKGQAR